MPSVVTRIARSALCLAGLLCMFSFGAASSATGDEPPAHQAQVEARIAWPPQAFRGSDGERHLAYELQLTSFQDDDDPLTLVQLALYADRAGTPLKTVRGPALLALAGRPERDGEGLPLAAGKSITLFMWVALPPGARPATLRDHLLLRTRKGTLQRADDIRTSLVEPSPVAIAPPLRGGPWLAVEGPGNHLSHHWGSMVAIGGKRTIPQRFAIDWFKLDARNHSLRGPHDGLVSTVDEDWIGYDQQVLAVADGVVVDARDGIPNGKPMTPLAPPEDLTARSLYGNFVVLRIAPGVYAHYAHLKAGSLTVRTGQRIHSGAVIGRLGQTGAAGAPHLHFHLSNRPVFEGSEGLPFVIDSFTRIGGTKIEETFDVAKAVELLTPSKTRAKSALPLDGDVVLFR